jgi:hypothetical protein
MSTERLCKAIEGRTVVSFAHRGERYTVEPHSVGYDAAESERANPLLLRAWHGGAWRDFEVRFMSQIKLEGAFAPRPGLGAMRIVLCDVLGKTWP